MARMKVIKEGGHRLLANDGETAAVVTAMLLDLEKNGLEAVRRYSEKFDRWTPRDFELTPAEIRAATAQLDPQVVADTRFCQDNVRRFAEAQLATMQPLEVEIRPGVTLGHRHIPVNSVGSYIPGGRYPMFGSAQMSIIPAKVAGVKTVVACTPPVDGRGWFPATINAIAAAGADRAAIKAELDKLYRLLGARPVNEAALAAQYPRTVSAAGRIDCLDEALRDELADINGRLVWLRQGAELYNLKERKQEEGWFYARMVEELEDLAYAKRIGYPGVDLDVLTERLAGRHYAQRCTDRAAIIAALDAMDAKLAAAKPGLQAIKAAYPGFIRTVSKVDPFDKELMDRLYGTHNRVADIDDGELSLGMMFDLMDVLKEKSSKSQWFLLDLYKFYLEPSLQEGIQNLQAMGAR